MNISPQDLADLRRRRVRRGTVPFPIAGFNPAEYPTPLPPDSVLAHVLVQGEPVSKQRPRFSSRHRHTYTPEETVAAERKVALLVKQAMRELFVDPRYAYGIRAVFYLKNGHRRDLDNMVKLLCDAITGVVWRDDSQVYELMAWRREDATYPRTDVVVYRLPVPAIRDDQACEYRRGFKDRHRAGALL